ncbi:MAG: D-alanyl-D-alanine carboxypeptidase [Candidatus Omnitrophica bacterium]|nr:D-alanyl-D-alanine carboxypeptidase [Candidatus Omnitrophota bacterium]
MRTRDTLRGFFLSLLPALAVLAVCGLTGCSRAGTPVEIDISAKSAMIMEAGSGKVLFEKNADKKLQPASTVKVMTALVAMENAPLEREVIPTVSVTGVEPTVIKLRPGVRYTLKDLISAVLIKSANDAAVAIAESVAGSEEDFVKLMNLKAAEIGLENTCFTSASGLPARHREDQYTTARDLAAMMRYALRYRFVLEAMSKKEEVIRGGDDKTILLETHNKSLFSKKGSSWGKTGYTKKAKRTFVGVDPSCRPRIVFAMLGSRDIWNDIAVLKEGGLEIYRRRRGTVLSMIIDWIRRGW